MSHRYTLTIVAVLFATLLTACGGGNSTPAASGGGSPSGPAAPTSAPVAAPTHTPVPTSTPVPTNTPAPTDTSASGSGSGCLAGTWQFDDMSEYFASVMSQAGNPAKFVGQEGTIIYSFGDDGSAKIEAQDFTVKLQITAQSLSLPIEIKMAGSATANYVTSEPDKITFSNNNIGDFKLSIAMNGQEVSSTTFDQLAAFGISSDPKYNSLTYECSGDTLKYTPPLPDAKPVVLKRIH